MNAEKRKPDFKTRIREWAEKLEVKIA